MIALIFLVALESSHFLQLSPGVMSQGLGGSSIMISEGLSVFQNPAYADDTRFNFTLSRWLYSTNYLAVGGSYKSNLFGIVYLGYGHIQGYDAVGNPTDQFAPYDIAIAIGRKLGSFGLAVRGFTEKIDGLVLYGLTATLGAYTTYKNLSLGLKVNNLGKEFSESTSIPMNIGFGLKYNIIPETCLLAEVKMPNLSFNSGLSYKYKSMKLLIGLRYIKARNMADAAPISVVSDDFSIAGGLIVDIENYAIGYAVVYGHFSVAHHFSVNFVP